MMVVMNFLNGDEYACFVVVGLEKTIYYKFNEFMVFTYCDFSRKSAR